MGSTLREARFHKEEMSQVQGADPAGCTWQTISALQQNRDLAARLLARRLARICGSCVENLFPVSLD